MNRTTQWLLVTIQVILVGVLLSAGRARAQQAPASVSAKACDPYCLSQPVTPEEEKKIQKTQEEFCRTHPGGCLIEQMSPPPMAKMMQDEAKQDPNLLNESGSVGHTNWCFSDPSSATKNVCIPGTWIGNNQPEYGHCYSNPNNSSEQRCVPTREQLMKAE